MLLLVPQEQGCGQIWWRVDLIHPAGECSHGTPKGQVEGAAALRHGCAAVCVYFASFASSMMRVQAFQTSFMTLVLPHEPRLAPKGVSGF